jgi:hypothetical protein
MYEYEPLDRERKEIRLLTLQPGSGNAMLFCTLATAYLDTPTPPRYETISYVCGDQTVKATINLHGSEVRVPATSEAALRRMRRSDRSRTLWIDAICINEADVAERGHQVGIMYEIYTHTRHNCIYLGPDDGSMPKVIKSMESMLREISVETRDYVDFNEMTLDTSGRPKSSDAPFSIDINRSGLLQFFENPWFSRLWVVQETSLGHISTCYCGVFYISLTDVLHVGRWLFHKPDQLPLTTTTQFISIYNASAIFDASSRAHGFFRYRAFLAHFLVQFAYFHTFDRRDQIFALVALWQMHTQTPVLPATLKPDYTLGVSEVFRKASEFAIQETGNLSLLRHVRASPDGKDIALWPSWVPVLDRKLKLEPDWMELRLNVNCKADDLWPTRVPSFDDGSNTLNVDGLMVDEVIDVTWIPTKLTASSLTTFVASAESLRPYSTWVGALGGGPEQRASLVLIAGRTCGFDRIADEEALQGYRSFKTYVKDRSCSPPPVPRLEASASDSEQAAARYAEGLRNTAMHRAVFHTKDGHLGLGPSCTLPGDIVAILYGCQWPVVMRPLPTPGEYTFLECAYVYGIMDGEAVRRHKELGREDVRFRIV